MSDATLDQVLRAVQNGNRNIRNHLRRQDQAIGEQLRQIVGLLEGHSNRFDRLEKRVEVLEEHVGI